LKGVTKVEPGYVGGERVEVVQIEYDPAAVKYQDLLTVFFGSHDATQVNRQGNDVGPEYRSVIFYTTEGQRQEAEAFIKELEESAQDGDPIATSVEPLGEFSPAESYHLDYYAKNKSQGYCQVIIAPKLQKVQEKFAKLIA
jgi:peptide-methionine (S)-S-oxide reductase